MINVQFDCNDLRGFSGRFDDAELDRVIAEPELIAGWLVPLPVLLRIRCRYDRSHQNAQAENQNRNSTDKVLRGSPPSEKPIDFKKHHGWRFSALFQDGGQKTGPYKSRRLYFWSAQNPLQSLLNVNNHSFTGYGIIVKRRAGLREFTNLGHPRDGRNPLAGDQRLPAA